MCVSQPIKGKWFPLEKWLVYQATRLHKGFSSTQSRFFAVQQKRFKCTSHLIKRRVLGDGTLIEQIARTASPRLFVGKTLPFSPTASAQGRNTVTTDSVWCRCGVSKVSARCPPLLWLPPCKYSHGEKGRWHQSMIREVVFPPGPPMIVVTARTFYPFSHVSLVNAHGPVKRAVSAPGLPGSSRFRPQQGPLLLWGLRGWTLYRCYT